MKRHLHKVIAFFSVIIIQNSYSQILIGINADLGKSHYTRESGRSTLKPGNAWSGGINVHFATAKRFNPLLGFGFTQKSYSSYEHVSNMNIPDYDITEARTYKGLYLNLGTRFNVLNKKHKVFIDVAMINNYILEQKLDFDLNDQPHDISYYKVDNAYYTACMFGIGYNYNNICSISALAKPALTSFENGYQSTRLHMYCINLCYFLPVLGNKKIKVNSGSTEPPLNP